MNRRDVAEVLARPYSLELLGSSIPARLAYRAAAAKTTSEPERRYLITQAARLNKSRTASEPGRTRRRMGAQRSVE